MKKILTALMALTMIFTMTACANSGPAEPEAPTVAPNDGRTYTDYETADVSGYYTMEDVEQVNFVSASTPTILNSIKNDKILLYFGYNYCPFCNICMPIVNDIAISEGVKVVYLDAYAEDFDDEMWEELMGLIPEMVSEDGSVYTPQLIAIDHGTVKDIQIGSPTSVSTGTDGYPEFNDEQKTEAANRFLEVFHALNK